MIDIETAQTVLMVVTEDYYFWSHRLRLARGIRDAGHRVHIATAPGKLRSAIEAEGFGYTPLTLERRGIRPLREWRSIRNLTDVMREVRPSIAHLVGMKPMVYGCIAAKRAGVPHVVCAVAGMGYAFLPGGLGKRMLREGIRQVFRRRVAGRLDTRVIVQNEDDRKLLTESKMAGTEQIAVICGAGVDLQRFSPAPFPDGVPVVLTHCRMLWDKGIGELAEAARMLRRRGVAVRFALSGVGDDSNPASIPDSQLNAWVREGLFEWRGRRADIPEQLAACHVACLPSYREGAPLSLIEAAACGRPIITTDVPGCREVVRQGENGFLVPARNAEALADALEQVLRDPALRERMGRQSRRRAEQDFDQAIVLRQTLALYRELLSAEGGPATPGDVSSPDQKRRAA